MVGIMIMMRVIIILAIIMNTIIMTILTMIYDYGSFKLEISLQLINHHVHLLEFQS